MANPILEGDLFIEWREKFNDSLTEAGDLTLLSTTDNSSLVNAINEVHDDAAANTSDITDLETDLGDVTTLTTTATTAVPAINELDAEIGDVTTLTTTATTIVPAINELDAEIGDTSSLTTTATTVVPAINELDGEIGDTSALVTTATDLAAAVNEIVPNGTPDFTVGAEAADVINVAVQLKQYDDSTNLTEKGNVYVYLSDDSAGDSISASAPTGGVAIGTNGLFIETIADKAGVSVSNGTGAFDLDITESGAVTFYLVVLSPGGKVHVSPAITFA